MIVQDGEAGWTYNIGGDSERRNIDIVKDLIDIHIATAPDGVPLSSKYQDYIEYVEDRKGHDFRYAIDHEIITENLGWKPKIKLNEGLKITYDYYKNNVEDIIRKVK